MSQLALPLPRTCPVRDVPFPDGHGSVRRHECGRYAESIWPCHDCDDHPGDPSVPAVQAFGMPPGEAKWASVPGLHRTVRYEPAYAREIHARMLAALFQSFPASALERLVADMDPAEAHEALETLRPPRTTSIAPGAGILEATWGARVVMLHRLERRVDG